MKPDSIEQLVLTARFVGANPDVEVMGEGMMEYKCNYFIGSDPSRWKTDVPNYEAVAYKNIYSGTVLSFQGTGDGTCSYEYLCASQEDLSSVKIAYEGIESTTNQSSGSTVFQTAWGDLENLIREPSRENNVHPEVDFAQLNNLGGKYASSSYSSPASPQFLGLEYSTYLGGGSEEWCEGIAVDCSGCAHVTGWTWSTDFPTPGGYDQYLGGSQDVFVAKFSTTGNSLIYSTYLGGSDLDAGYGIAIGYPGSGITSRAYITGATTSDNFPTRNGYDASYNGVNDAFVVELSNAGNTLEFSTYLGGEGSDAGAGVTVDVSGSVYVTGTTRSLTFPIMNAYDASYDGVGDAFVTKLSSSGGTLTYSTYLGGSSDDRGEAIALDNSGPLSVAIVTGATYSNNFPTKNAFDATYNDSIDVFVTKLSLSGNLLSYSTYIGGSRREWPYDIAVDGSGCAYLVGITRSLDFPLQSYCQSYNGSEDAFVTKLAASGSALLYSTYLGGSANDLGYGIAVDGFGYAFVTGATGSQDFPVIDAYDASCNGSDVFVAKLFPSGSSLVFGTFVGGNEIDEGYDIAIDNSGMYVCGLTESNDFPTRNAYDAIYTGGSIFGFDGFVAKLAEFEFLCGDADGSGAISISDAVYLINYIFAGGPAPNPVLSGDADCTGAVSISDAVYLINYIFAGGPAPCAACK
ncbi:MAG: SBBP repeat-containing protein [candidate division Zixibacteria bacterium]|nr:SBBP repeat-containing protein [candidate division Zixibacteria bacterium]